MWLSRYQDEGWIYSLNQSRRAEFPAGVISASFNCMALSSPEIDLRWLRLTSLSKLTTNLHIDSLKLRWGLEFFDEIKLAEEAEKQRQRLLHDYGDGSRHLLLLEQFVGKLTQRSYIRVSSCQRSSTEPMRSNSHRNLEEQEFRTTLPYLEAIFQSMAGLELKPPFREVAYYQGLVRRLMERI